MDEPDGVDVTAAIDVPVSAHRAAGGPGPTVPGVAARRPAGVRRVGLAWVTATAVGAGLAFGPRAFGAFAVAVAAAALLEGSALAARGLAQPVVPAAGLVGLALPVFATLDPTAALAQLPLITAGLVLATFALLLVFGRRAQVTAAAAATCLVGLLVGLGSTSLVLLRAAPAGLRWSAALVVLVALPEAAVAAASAARLRLPASAVRLGVALAFSALLAALSTWDPAAPQGLAPGTVAALTVVTLLASEGCRRAGATLVLPAGRLRRQIAVPRFWEVLAGGLVSAPAALLLAQVVRP